MDLVQSTNWGHFPDQIGICKCWFLRRGENRGVPGEKHLRERMRTNNRWSVITQTAVRENGCSLLVISLATAVLQFVFYKPHLSSCSVSKFSTA